MPAERALVILLRTGGTITVTAFLAMFLPVDWMASTHRSLGLGEFPQAPITDYLARSVSAFYGFHGVLLFLISGDPVRFRPVVRYVGWMSIAFGVCLLGIDLHAGLPAYWTAAEGPGVFVIGIAVLFLSRSPRRT